ncbi:hypothetical protein NM208_g5696 [Fusarium decemcellulare]|uniref:Uncharacterized protein n=1 Tax=Fusarium decemcellulare TaxID=57161 RepID=A0ACC1SFX6_9HYPO|nr:hypothetical protein NM208_g5696 [Fusarium decemcellulare]
MFTTLILLALAGSIMATPPSLRNARSYDQPSTPKPVLNWGDCDPGLVITAQKLGLTTKAFCANMTVPLDYTDTESNRTHTVEVVKVAARVEKPRGSIILNFGGPGGNGVQTLLTSPWYMNATGGEHDLISFEPRGTSQHFLRASCFDSPVERRFSQQSNPARHLLSESKDEKTVTTAWEHAGASAKAFADVCASTLENVGPYLGTAFTARDIMSIVDGLGEEKLNYWGISYGTVLGATLAGMFPGRMGRLVLDAVATPTKYYNSFYGPENYEAIDTLFKAMLEACVKAGPEGCPLASGNSTADALEQQVFDLFDSLKTQPLVWAGELVDFTQPSAGTYLDDTALRGWTISISYNPMNYHILLAAIAGLLDGNVAAAVGARALAESSTEAVQAGSPRFSRASTRSRICRMRQTSTWGAAHASEGPEHHSNCSVPNRTSPPSRPSHWNLSSLPLTADSRDYHSLIFMQIMVQPSEAAREPPLVQTPGLRQGSESIWSDFFHVTEGDSRFRCA